MIDLKSPASPAAQPAGGTLRERATLRLTDDEWMLAADLLSRGVTAQGVLQLLRLRAVYRRLRAPSLDGFRPDARALFARWLVAQGRLTETT